MIKNIYIILTILLLQSCGSPFQKDKIIKAKASFQESNPYFDIYKEEFSRIYYEETGETIELESLPINFSESTFENMGNTIGVCHYTQSNGEFRGLEIIIKESNWKLMDNSCRQFLVAHEIGHCALNKDHIDDHPSIMNSKITYCETYLGLARFFNSEFINGDELSINILKFYLQ